MAARKPDASAAPSTKALGKRKQQEEDREAVNGLGELSLSEGEDFPEIDLGSDGSATEPENDAESDDDDEEEDEEALMQAERLEEEQLERELREEEEADNTDASSDLDSSASLTDLIQKYSGKPNEEDPDTPGTSVDGKSTNSSLLGFGFDTRPYQRKRRTTKSDITGEDKFEWDENEPGYDSADSGGDDPENRIGNVPSYFYEDMPHIGYNMDGKKVMKPATADELDKFLSSVDGSAWTSVLDKTTGQQTQLTDQELDIIQRLSNQQVPDADYDPYEPTIEWFTSKTMDTPLNARPEPKRRFIPSKWEHQKVMKIVAAIRQGRIVPGNRQQKRPAEEKPTVYNIWSDETDVPRPDHPMHMPAPKVALPGHAESYNPPVEYLFNEEEKKEWEDADPQDRAQNYMPQKHDALRKVGAYQNFVQERFERCLDLYLAPRTRRRKARLPEDPEELVPKLPSPNELKPFPQVCSTTYPHPNGVRTRAISIDPSGQWVVTGADDGEVRLWELRVGRCQAVWRVGKLPGGATTPVQSLAWCPVKGRLFFVAATENKLTFISPIDLLDPKAAEATTAYLFDAFNAATGATAQNSVLKWAKAGEAERDQGVLLHLQVPGTPKQITWHRRGDYFATVAADGGNQAVLIHQITKHQTQAPFKRSKGRIISQVAFHPTKPQFFVASQHDVRLYDLLAQTLVKTLHPGVKMLSCMDVHPLGDHVLVGSYDKRVVWHDLDLSDRPYRTLRYHTKAVRSLKFHNSHPLFCTAADDGSIHVFHATVYSDLVTEPLIVPLKVLHGHQVVDSLGVLNVQWHPKEPWLVSVGADGVGRLYCN